MASEWVERHPVRTSDSGLVVKSHLIKLMKEYGDLEEVKRLESIPDEHVLGNQIEIDAQDIETGQPESHPVPELPSYIDADGPECRRYRQRVEDREARLSDGGAPRESEYNEDVKSRSLFVSGVNGPSERDKWLIVNYISRGAIDTGAVECGGRQRHRNGMLVGPLFIRVVTRQIRNHIWHVLDGREA